LGRTPQLKSTRTTDVGNNSGMDKGLLALIQGVLGTRHGALAPQHELPEGNPPALPESLRAEAVAPPEGPDGPAAETVAAKEPDQPAESYDRRKTADELAGIILKALQTLDGVPASGFVVTVYGGNPWNAMLTIKPEAGPIADPDLWRARVRDMAARLRQDFDVAET
jgi:hypothetical protein